MRFQTLCFWFQNVSCFYSTTLYSSFLTVWISNKWQGRGKLIIKVIWTYIPKYILISVKHEPFFFLIGNDMGNDDAIGGNVSKYMVLPSGYCGQPKKGHLIFDACFESGECIKDCCFWICLRLFQNPIHLTIQCDSTHLLFHHSGISCQGKITF